MARAAGMLFVATVALVLGVCLAANPVHKFKSAAPPVYSTNPQDMWLAKQNTGNFGCKVDQVVVSTESPPVGDEVITKDALRSAFENTATLEWAHIAQTSFSSMDGRNEEKVLSTPGGDMGEFVQAIHALAKVAGREITEEEVQQSFERYLAVMSREKFSYETDERAYTKLAVATGCKNLHVADMGSLKRKKESFLEKVALPEHIGDPFIKFLALNATELEINPDYIKHALTAFHNVLWTKPSPLSQRLCYLQLKGPHQESALVSINIPEYCIDQGLAPMISPALACAAPVMVVHEGAVKIFRRELVSVLSIDFPDLDPRDILAALNTMAEDNLDKFWGYFGSGLATFKVSLKKQLPSE